MKSFFASPALIALAFAPLGAINAQTLSFESVSGTPTNFAGASGLYRTIENSVSGTAIDNSSYSFIGYNVRVGSGTGSGASLVGQDFLALCVNLDYGAPGASPVSFAHATDGTGISYTPAPSGTRDYWAADSGGKYDAIKDIVATYGNQLTGDQNLAEFQEWTMALTLAFSEIVADYGTGYSLSTGDMQIYLAGGTDPLPASILSKYDQAILAAGNGSGAGLTLNSASIGGTQYQDVILLPIPEPATPLLAGAAAMLGLLRRRRVA